MLKHTENTMNHPAKSRFKKSAVGLIFCTFLTFVAGASDSVIPVANAADTDSGLHLPRFAALRATRVNLRKGPGVRFPIEWVYLQRDLPVEIIQVFDNWRRVRDWEGTEGWVYHSMLTGRRSVRITQNMAVVRKTPDLNSAPLAKLEIGVVGRLQKCPAGSTVCLVSLGGIAGWLPRTSFWGVYQNEVVD